MAPLAASWLAPRELLLLSDAEATQSAAPCRKDREVEQVTWRRLGHQPGPPAWATSPGHQPGLEAVRVAGTKFLLMGASARAPHSKKLTRSCDQVQELQSRPTDGALFARLSGLLRAWMDPRRQTLPLPSQQRLL
jgi:hypothetical protein